MPVFLMCSFTKESKEFFRISDYGLKKVVKI